MGKPMTQTTKGGCTTDAYGHREGEALQKTKGKGKGIAEKTPAYAISTYPKTRFITSMYPQYLTTRAWKRRIHHEFLWKLMPTPEVKIDLTKEAPEARSGIDHLFPEMRAAYERAKIKKR